KYCSVPCAHACQKHGIAKTPLAVRFWTHVEKTESCWLWIGGKRNKHHQIVDDDGKSVGVHRVSWELHFGPIPDGLFVCHNCPGGDNPACVRPEHLFLGTQAENVRDMHRKGRAATGERSPARLHPERMPRGETHWNARLTTASVQQIRTDADLGSLELSKVFGVSQGAIKDVLARRTWRDVG